MASILLVIKRGIDIQASVMLSYAAGRSSHCTSEVNKAGEMCERGEKKRVLFSLCASEDETKGNLNIHLYLIT